MKINESEIIYKIRDEISHIPLRGPAGLSYLYEIVNEGSKTWKIKMNETIALDEKDSINYV